MNSEQVKSALRTLIIAGFAWLGGYALHAHWITEDALNAFLNGPVGAAFAGIIVTGVWGVINKTNANLVASASAVPEVKAVITTATPAGVAMAAAGADNVVSAGTVQAVAVAKAA